MPTDEEAPKQDDASEPEEAAPPPVLPQSVTGLRPPDDPINSKMDRSRDVARLAKHSYLAGFAGALAVMGMGYLGAKKHVLTKGWGIGQGEFDINLSMAFVLLIVAIVMFSVELFIRLDVDKGRLVKVSSLIKQKRIDAFVLQCVKVYIAEVAIFSTGIMFLRTASEYAFDRKGGYYAPWFAVMDTFFWIYMIGGLPYVLFTRALQHSPKSDRKQAAFVVLKSVRHLWTRHSAVPFGVAVLAAIATEIVLPRDAPVVMRTFYASGLPLFVWYLASRFERPRPAEAESEEDHEGDDEVDAAPANGERPLFDRYDKSAVVGLFVKLFYVPLMTVFFSDQFTHLVKNYEWFLGPDFKLENVTIRDVHNVAYTIIFAVDVGLAWCGYAVTSRWIKNTIFSAEPTFLGWSVALLCYPPFNRFTGFYFPTPSENGFFSLPSAFAVKVFAIASILSFTVYTSATVVFGLRFSNLTHRGIVTTGPYSLIRHPAYASKNFSWWCVMLPYVIWEVWSQKTATPLLQVVGMVIMSGIYYWRAITEERHLMRDEEYRRYMKKVPYRFIPGVL